MGSDGYGWTLLFQRRGGRAYQNTEGFGDDLIDFIRTAGGTIDQLSYERSYSLGTANWPADLSRYRFIQYGTDLTPDLDDASILQMDTPPFRENDNGAQTPVAEACDHRGQNCLTGALFRFSGRSQFSGVGCNDAHQEPTGTSRGHYSACRSASSARSGDLFGDRYGYAETKVWGGSQTQTSATYMERVFAR